MSKLCKECIHRRSSDGWCKVKEKHVPKKTDKEGNVTTCERFSPKRR